jgi:hypothetical protein
MSASEPIDEHMEDEEEDEDEMCEEDGFDPIMSVLMTDDGETLPTILVSLKSAVEKIADTLDTQNKILIKLLSAMAPR